VNLFKFKKSLEVKSKADLSVLENSHSIKPLFPGESLGLIAGSGNLPLNFIRDAQKSGFKVSAICHENDTLREIENLADSIQWIKVGQLGKIIEFFKKNEVKRAVMLGGINRVRLFGGIKLDTRGALMIARIRSVKDDDVMRGVAEELKRDGVEIVSSTIFLQDSLVEEGLLTSTAPTAEEKEDIQIGIKALKAMSELHIGQVVIVREGVVVAVEATEGTDQAILRGGKLGGEGTVIVKFAKATQDMRFDVPTIGIKTIQSMIEAKAKVLALEAGRCLLLDREEVIALANKNKISIIGCPPLK
jgi:UDP-2,3-diacylglucosamine hydrolase